MDVDVSAVGRLPHLVLDDVTLLPQTRAEKVGMYARPTRVLEHVVQTAFDVCHQPMRRAAWTRFFQQGDLVSELVADQRQRRGIEQRRGKDFRRARTDGDRLTQLVYRFDDEQVI